MDTVDMNSHGVLTGSSLFLPHPPTILFIILIMWATIPHSLVYGTQYLDVTKHSINTMKE